MRIAELAQRTNVPITAIKFYVREGLLPAGDRVGHNQTSYGEQHVNRLRLVRALIEVGGLSVSDARLVLEAIGPSVPLDQLLRAAQNAASIRAEATAKSVARVREEIERQGWKVGKSNPGIQQCAAVLDAYEAMGRSDLARIDFYATASLAIAEVDLAFVAQSEGDRDAAAQTVVLGTALGDKLLAGIRRIAQEHVTRAPRTRSDQKDTSNLERKDCQE